MLLDGSMPESTAYAAQLLRAGQLVAFPTETVYGLGANARDESAIARIYALKQRPLHHPLIIHLGTEGDPAAWTPSVSGVAQRLMDRFWPGPLTLILARSNSVPAAVAGGQNSVGLRKPSHPVAAALLDAFAQGATHTGVAAPSANRFGHVSPTLAAHVRDEFGDQVTILDGGSSAVGIESTIVDLTRVDSLGAMVLRPGAITRVMLAEILGYEPSLPDGDAPRVSGSLKAHYAPRTPLRLVPQDALTEIPERVAVWGFTAPSSAHALWQQAPLDAPAYAFALYSTLRVMDTLGASEIWIEMPPKGPQWDGVWDRLARAAAGSGM